MYKTLQTGPKAPFGGLHSGFLMSSYQDFMLGMVIKLPAKPPIDGRIVIIIAIVQKPQVCWYHGMVSPGVYSVMFSEKLVK